MVINDKSLQQLKDLLLQELGKEYTEEELRQAANAIVRFVFAKEVRKLQ